MTQGNLTLQMTGDVDSGALQEQGLWTVWVNSSQISWIRCLGAMQAQPDLRGCTGVAWDVTGIGARAFFWTAGVAGTAGAWFIQVLLQVQWMWAACVVQVGAMQVMLLRSGVLSEPALWQLCHLGQCWPLWHCVHEGVSICGSMWNHCWCILYSCSVVGHVSQ